MSSSLNAGSEFENELQDEAPEGLALSEESEQFLAMESALADLAGLANDIWATGGMSRGFAMEAHRIMPDVLSAKVEYFSASPSGTRFKVSLEEIDKGVWALVIAGVTIVLGAIYKIWKWLSGDKDGDGNSGTASGGVSKNIETVESTSETTVAAADGMLHAGNELRANPIQYQGKDGTVRWNSMDQLIDAVFINDDRYGEEKKSLLSPHPIHRDIVDNGPYTKMMHQLANANVFSKAADAIKGKIKLLEEIEHKDRNAQGQQLPGIQQQMDKIAEPITLTFEGKTMSLAQLAGRLRDARETVEKNTNTNRLHYDELFHKISTAYKDKHLVELLKQMLNYMPVLDQMQAGLERTERFAGDLSQDGQPGGNSPQVAQRIRALISVMHDQLTGFTALTNEINHYVHHFKALSKLTEGFGKEIVRKVSLRMKEAEVTEIPMEWKKISAGIQASLDAMEKSHYPSGSKRRGIMNILGG